MDPDQQREMIGVRDLQYRYAGASRDAVADLSFEIPRGEIFGFLGPSGAGKSTTQKILIGLIEGFSGEVHILGRKLGDWGSELYERIGVSFERPNHFLKLTGLENLRYFAALYGGETQDPLALLGEVGLDGDANVPVGAYSKGMQNRLSFARALLNNPELLFLDEPTAGLDPVNAHRVKELIARRREEGAAVFLSTHNMQVADDLCDRVAFLVDGRIALLDSPRELKLRFGRRSVRLEFGVGDAGEEEREFPLEDLADNAEFLSALRREDLKTIHTQETTLEQIFIQATGARL